MFKRFKWVAVVFLAGGPIAQGQVLFEGIGQVPSGELIAAWNDDIRSDGRGLPVGGATAEMGEGIYDAQCAQCHGAFGEGENNWPKLAGSGDLTAARPALTVGSYWPYAATLWDYVNRAMPFYAPGSLEVQQVYAVTAYVLYLNELVEYDQWIDQHSLAQIKMPNANGFAVESQVDTQAVRCFSNCLTVPQQWIAAPSN